MRHGTGIVEFFDRFPHEEACLDHIHARKWSTQRKCPRCGVVGEWKKIKGTKKYRHNCGQHHSVLRETAFYRSNLSIMAYFYALLLFSNSSSGVRAAFVRKQLGIGMKAAHRLCGKVRLHMAAYKRPDRLGGPGKTVYVDEVYVKYVVDKDGKKKRPAIVLGIMCDGLVLSGIIPDRRGQTLAAAINKLVRRGSKIITDDWGGYRRLSSLGFEHMTINHSSGYFFDFYGNSTCEIDSYWATLKRALRLYHQVSDKYLWLYLAEIEFRYNHRFLECRPFEDLINHWPKLDSKALEKLTSRYEWN